MVCDSSLYLIPLAEMIARRYANEGKRSTRARARGTRHTSTHRAPKLSTYRHRAHTLDFDASRRTFLTRATPVQSSIGSLN